MRVVRALAVLWITLLMVNGCSEDGRKAAGGNGESPTADAQSAYYYLCAVEAPGARATCPRRRVAPFLACAGVVMMAVLVRSVSSGA